MLYDVTTLYFEAEKEDGLRKVGFSKERRVDPQIVVGLLVDRNGFPLEIGCFEGNRAEKLTIVPIIEAFKSRHRIENMIIVADAGMLSAGNLTTLDEAGFRFIVGSRQSKAPIDLESHFHWHGDAFTDGQVVDTITPKRGANTANDTALRAEPVWDPRAHPGSWRAVWAYSAKRFARDNRTLNAQEARARAVVDGDSSARTPRFVKNSGDGQTLDEKALARARRLAGLKGYVTNLPASGMDAGEVIAAYHDLWNVEASFRMSKTDLAARPMFHRTRDSIEAHLTIVFTALAVARTAQTRTGLSIRRIVRSLRPLRSATIAINGAEQSFPPPKPSHPRSHPTSSRSSLHSAADPSRTNAFDQTRVERQALLNHGVRACFQTTGGQLNLFDQLRLWLRWWNEIEKLVDEYPGPWLASVARVGASIFDSRADAS